MRERVSNHAPYAAHRLSEIRKIPMAQNSKAAARGLQRRNLKI
jgi:hypothetical protein